MRTGHIRVVRPPPVAPRDYLVAAGLEQALEFLENVRFTTEEVSYLRQHRMFRHIRGEFFDYLAQFRFTDATCAMPEGTLAFPGGAPMRIVAPIIEAQIMETFSALDARLPDDDCEQGSARRHRRAGPRSRGFRRAAGAWRPGQPPLGARAAVIGGCFGTSNVLAGQQFGIDTYGTQAHSWVMAHENEAESFRNFLEAFPEGSVLLLDTYDVRNAVKTIIELGRQPAGVRLDSGDLIKDSRWVRRDSSRRLEGREDLASGDLDEFKIAELLAKGAAIDAFGVGTALATPGDAPHLSLIYKLVEVERAVRLRGSREIQRGQGHLSRPQTGIPRIRPLPAK